MSSGAVIRNRLINKSAKRGRMSVHSSNVRGWLLGSPLVAPLLVSTPPVSAGDDDLFCSE